MLGKPDNVDEYVSKGGHDYRPDLRLAIFRFINKHLKGDTGAVEGRRLPEDRRQGAARLPRRTTTCRRTRSTPKVDETFVPMAKVKLPAKPEEFAEWKAGLVKQLREKSFRSLPEKLPGVRMVWGDKPGDRVEKAGDGELTIMRPYSGYLQ